MIRNRVTLKQIEALVYVADLGTFRKAAAALGTTQPNISVRIAAIEDTLDVVLMHRDAGAVRMTAKGHEILLAARAILRSTEDMLDVAQRRDLVEEKLRLGVTELVALTWLPDFLREVKLTYPALRVELTVDLSQKIEEQLLSSELDIAILADEMANAAFTSLPLGSYQYGWVTSPDIAVELGESPDFSQMFELGLLSHSRQTQASKTLRDHLGGQGLLLDGVTHSSSLPALIHMAADGMGIALVPRQLYIEHLADGRLVEVNSPWAPSPLSFVTCYNTVQASRFVERIAQISVDVSKGTAA
jgi:DNA-binding transcriptional LysR family regulator